MKTKGDQEGGIHSVYVSDRGDGGLFAVQFCCRLYFQYISISAK
jgi:hypothetical protein